MVLAYMEPKRISLKTHPQFNERWVQERIVENPAILGLGDLDVKDQERRQPRAGRLDLLLQDSLSSLRFEVELQLGATDESHIIRTIEYWDIERRRYPQYEHCAVIIAESITSRFLNVISLFNGFIPLIAIQLSALEVNGVVTLVATKVMDQMTLGSDEEDEGEEPKDRGYWETRRGTKATVKLVDQMLELVREVEPDIGLKYNKFYVGLAQNGIPNNFITFRPRKKHLIVEFKIPRSDELTQRLEDEGMDTLDYQARWGQYRMRIEHADIAQHRELLRELVRMAHEASGR